MKKTLTNALLFILLIGNLKAQDTTGNRIISVTSFPCKINFLTDSVTSFTEVSIDSISYNNSSAGYALFQHPVTYKLYVVADSIYNGNHRDIYELNPITGQRSFVMATGNFFSSLEITNTGRVFGIVGQNAQPPMNKGEIYEFDLTNKTKTLVTTIPISSSSTKTSLGFNPADQFLYAFSSDFSNLVDTLTKINITNFNFTRSGADWGNYEIDGAFYYAPDTFLFANYGYKHFYYKISADTIVMQKTLNSNQMDVTRIKLINSAETRTFCAGSSINLPVVFNAANYQWYKNGTLIPGANSGTLSVNAAGTYNVLIEIDSTKYLWSEKIAVTQLNIPTVSISAPQGLVFCANDTITLVGSSGGTSQWYQNGIAISGATSNTLTVTSAGVYNMMKTNSNGCADSASVGSVVTVNSLPSVTLSSQPTFCPNQTQIALTGGLPAGGVYSGTGVINNSDFNPSASGPGSYVINYTYTDTNNCSNTASDTLTVDVCAGISSASTTNVSVFPNPFDKQLTISTNSLNNSVVIFNSLSQVVYENKSVKNNSLIDLGFLPVGFYSIKIENEKGVSNFRIIKN